MRHETLGLALLVAVAGCGDVTPDAPETAAPISLAQPARLTNRIPPEERLHYVRMPNLGDALKTGGRVDIVAVFEPSGVAHTLLQNASVLDIRPAEGSMVSVGLTLTTDEVLLLELAHDRASLVPLARSAGDTDVSTVRRTTLREVLEGLEVLQSTRLARATSDAEGIPLGERAMRISHGLPVGVLVPGNHVDIHGTFVTHIAAEDSVAIPLLSDVTVLGIVDDAAIVAVSVDEAITLALAQDAGELTFVLRNSEDNEVSSITKKTLREVLEDLEVIQEKRQIRTRRRPRKMKMSTIEIIRGDGNYSSTGESYADYGTNEFTDVTADPLSTFAADVDTASFTIARRKLLEGTRPPPASVRVEEWLNYFTYNYPRPTDGPFSISMEAAPSPFQTSPEFRLLRVGIQGKTLPIANRKPVHLTFLVDVSGSMSSADKLPLAQKSLSHLVGALQPNDTVALATYAGRTEILLEPTTAAHRGTIIDAIERLQSGGGTAMSSGLASAYELAQRGFVAGHENRVIVLSDGDANVGPASLPEMQATISGGVKRGVTLSTIGFGMGNYKDDSMEQLANTGNGNYFYVDGMDEARRVFGDQLDGTLQTIAKDVKIQVEFNPGAVKRYRLVGYENRAIADRDFRNDAVDAGEIGAGHTVTALYELELQPGAAEVVATVRVRHKAPHGSDRAEETAVELRAADMQPRLADTSSDFRFAAAVAAFAEISRESKYAKPFNHDWVIEVARGAQGTFGDRAEFVGLVERARAL